MTGGWERLKGAEALSNQRRVGPTRKRSRSQDSANPGRKSRGCCTDHETSASSIVPARLPLSFHQLISELAEGARSNSVATIRSSILPTTPLRWATSQACQSCSSSHRKKSPSSGSLYSVPRSSYRGFDVSTIPRLVAPASVLQCCWAHLVILVAPLVPISHISR